VSLPVNARNTSAAKWVFAAFYFAESELGYARGEFVQSGRFLSFFSDRRYAEAIRGNRVVAHQWLRRAFHIARAGFQ
jgi:hypothetical protein